MVSLVGESAGYSSLEDDRLALSDTRILTANAVVAWGDEFASNPANNLVLGSDHVVGTGASGNTVIGNGTRIADGVVNATSIGRVDTILTESDRFDVGDFITYRANGDDGQVDGTCTIMGDAVVARSGRGGVQLAGGLANIDENGAAFSKTVSIFSKSGGWTMSVEPSLDDEGAEDLVLRSRNGSSVVFSDSFVPSVTNFTGQHRCIFDGIGVPREGYVVVCTGEFRALQPGPISVDEAIPIVSISSRRREPRAFGVVSSLESSGETRRVQVGNVSFMRRKSEGFCERRLVVNGSGEGGILACGSGGDIMVGDLLCTSSHPGVVEKQGTDIVSNYTCAKATGGCKFASEGGQQLIGCIYKF